MVCTHSNNAGSSAVYGYAYKVQHTNTESEAALSIQNEFLCFFCFYLLNYPISLVQSFTFFNLFNPWTVSHKNRKMFASEQWILFCCVRYKSKRRYNTIAEMYVRWSGFAKQWSYSTKMLFFSSFNTEKNKHNAFPYLQRCLLTTLN